MIFSMLSVINGFIAFPENIALVGVSVVLLVLAGLNIYLLRTRKQLVHSQNENENTDISADVDSDYQKELENLRGIVKFQKEELAARQKQSEDLETSIDSEVLKRTTELHTLLEKSEEGNKLKDAFLEKISREVRTPLNAILGFINLLSNPGITDHDRAYYYKYIQNSGNYLLALIDNIIDFSKLETNELLIEPKKCRVQVLLADMVEKHRNRILREDKDLTIVFNSLGKDQEAIVDCKRVIHIADQLLSNAIKYTSEGRIEVSYQVKDDCHYFTVSDTGIGIDKKHQDVIFERFYQISSDANDISQGAGLGLTIAKGLVDLLGGNIWLESEPGKGSLFTFTIPFIGANAMHQKEKIDAKSIDWSGKTILIAEDEDSNYHFLEAVLNKTKVTLLRANDGVEFLEMMDVNKNVDLVLLDIKMPGINGINAIKVVRQQNITIPVIAQTAFNQPEDKQRCLDSGCNDYLSKPIDKELLLNKISHFFSS